MAEVVLVASHQSQDHAHGGVQWQDPAAVGVPQLSAEVGASPEAQTKMQTQGVAASLGHGHASGVVQPAADRLE